MALLFCRATVLSWERCELAWVDPWDLASDDIVSSPPLYSLCFDPLDLELFCDVWLLCEA